MSPFHVAIHVAPENVEPGKPLEYLGQRWPTVAVESTPLDVPFGVTFEQVSEALAAFPRLFIEPDGSFVWNAAPNEPRWQLDGMLYDRNDRLIYVELKGSCSPQAFESFLAILHSPPTPLLFELPREGALLTEETFRQIFFGASDK